MRSINENTEFSAPDSLADVPEEMINHRVPGAKEDIEMAVIDITPEMAREWLKKNRQNRKVRTDRVKRYAEQMRDGEWMVSPDCISFSYTGKLINGQHRLKAISRLEKGEKVQCAVMFGLDPAAFKISDVGIKRTGADVLRIEGFKSPEEKAAVCRLLALWQQGRLEELHRYENVENSTIVDIASACRERLTEVIEKVGSDKKALDKKMPRSLMAFAHFAYKPSFPTRAEHFFNGFLYDKNFPAVDWAEEYGEDGAKSPIKLLKDKMRSEYDRLERKAKMALLIKAMNAYCLEKPMKQLRWRTNESLPEIQARSAIPELEAKQNLFT